MEHALGKNKDFEQLESLAQFIDSGRLEDVLGVIKSGKEATVYLCTGGALIDEEFVAAKVYRSLDVRTFRDDAAYRHGRTRGSSRQERAIGLKTRTGRDLRFSQWMTAEYETLRMLHSAGADVPRPIAHGGQAVLMEYVCDDDGEPAPTLNHARVSSSEAAAVYDRLIHNIELMLANDRVHGDLSPFNVLYGAGGRVALIDFPQAVDPRFNSNALALLERDVERICAWAGRHDVATDAFGTARAMWRRFVRSEM
jgi:RIO kinase 1